MYPLFEPVKTIEYMFNTKLMEIRDNSWFDRYPYEDQQIYATRTGKNLS